MIRILHYVGRMDIGGLENLLMEIYRKIDRKEIQFDFAVHTNDKCYYDEEIKKLGGKIYHFPKFSDGVYNYKKCWSEFWKQNHNIYSCFCFNTNSLANMVPIKICRKYHNVRIVIHSHSSYAKKNKLQFLHDLLHKINRKFLLKSTDLKIACSKDAGQWLFGKKNFYVLPNGINYDKYKFNKCVREKIRSEINPNNKYLIIQNGHFFPVKNYKFSIEIADKLKNREVIFLFIGDGTQRAELEELVRVKGLTNVMFLGARNNIDEYLSAADLFLCPSLFEGFSISTLEAEVSGINCIVSSGVPTLVKISNRINFMDLNLDDWVIKINQLIDEGFCYNRKIEFDDKFEINKISNEYCRILIKHVKGDLNYDINKE